MKASWRWLFISNLFTPNIDFPIKHKQNVIALNYNLRSTFMHGRFAMSLSLVKRLSSNAVALRRKCLKAILWKNYFNISAVKSFFGYGN